jgi:hypothetical protein
MSASVAIIGDGTTAIIATTTGITTTNLTGITISVRTTRRFRSSSSGFKAKRELAISAEAKRKPRRFPGGVFYWREWGKPQALLVITGLDPVIYDEGPRPLRLSMDGRIKSGHDEI